ncbi:MAG: phosphoglucosamine mutase [Promethearchaeota archaeon]
MAWAPQFGTSGIRGSVPNELNPTIAWHIGLSIATFFRRKPLLLGHDNRTSSPLLAEAMASGLMAGGSQVLFCGEIITPAVSFYTRHRQLAGAIIITGSHIPAHMSGIEVLASDGAPLDRDSEGEIERLIETKMASLPWRRQGKSISLIDVGTYWVKKVIQQVNAKLIAEHNFCVTVDACNGSAIPWLLDAINGLGCKVIGVNAHSDPFFSGRSPNLRVKLLGNTVKIVKEKKCDLGVAVDGDGDRAFFIDDKGRALMGDVTGTVLACIELDRRGGGTIVTPINSSNLIEDMAKLHKGKVVYSRIGPPAIVDAVKKHKAIFAFEESGKIIYPQLNYLSDSGLAAARLLEYLAEQDTSLSQIIDSLPHYQQLKQAIDCPNHLKKSIIEHVLSVASNEYPDANLITLDGVKLVFGDGWLLLRPSGTEPVFRCFAEARTRKRARELLKQGLDWINIVLKS